MATRTISNTGGNYNAVGTWVEGIVPTSADDVVATATSGQLTVNVGSAASTINFTNYTNTLTINSSFTLTVSGVGTSTFVSAMSTSIVGIISFTGVAATIITAGLTFSGTFSLIGNKTLSGNLNVTNLTTSGSLTISGTSTINVSGNITGAFTSPLIGTGITLNLTGAGTIGGLFSLLLFNINASGTYNFNNTQGIGFNVPATGTAFKYTAGTLTGTKRIVVSHSTTTTTTLVLDMGSSTGWELNLRWPSNTSNTSSVIRLDSDFNFDKIYFWSPAGTQPIQTFWLINGVGALKGGKLILNPIMFTNQFTTSFLQYNNYLNIKLGSTASHLISQLESSGFDGSNNIISSQTASTTAYLGVSGTQSIQLTNFTDIDASTGAISVFRGTLTRTTGITNYNSYSGGSSGGSWTFIN